MDNVVLENGSNFTINIDNLKRCFATMNPRSLPSQQIITEIQKYVEECRKNLQFPVILLNIFDNPAEVSIIYSCFLIYSIRSILYVLWQ